MASTTPNFAALSASVGMERVTGLSEIRARLDELAGTCSRSLWAFQPGGAQSAACLAATRPLDEDTLGRGVEMRTVYLSSALNDAPTVEHAHLLARKGAEVRTCATLPMRMLVVDQTLAVIPVDPADSALGALVVATPAVVAALSALFVAVWRTSTPFTTRRPARAEPLNAQERSALELWGQGQTDVVVARRLGVSHRTVRRISETVARTLGARSRFELGLKAGERGLIHSRELH